MGTHDPIPTLKFERQAWKAGALSVAGVDEVGVGPLAGPVTAGVVMLEPRRRPKWYRHVRDSKVLPERVRVELSAEIRASVPWAIGWASVEEIDCLNIYRARKLCMVRAIDRLSRVPDAIISDALRLPLRNVNAVIDGDALSIAVAAASIIAKVERDALMDRLCEQYPGYGFCHNKGYPTPEHKALLLRRGPCPVHRRSFAPVAQFGLGL